MCEEVCECVKSQQLTSHKWTSKYGIERGNGRGISSLFDRANKTNLS